MTRKEYFSETMSPKFTFSACFGVICKSEILPYYSIAFRDGKKAISFQLYHPMDRDSEEDLYYFWGEGGGEWGA